MIRTCCVGLLAAVGLASVGLASPPPPPVVSGYVPVERPLPPVVVVVRPVTHQEFAACFTPTCGTHEVTFLHPGNGCPVTVCFTLPAGCPKVHVHKRELEFDYGKHEVRIRFQIGGKVKVTYD